MCRDQLNAALANPIRHEAQMPSVVRSSGTVREQLDRLASIEKEMAEAVDRLEIAIAGIMSKDPEATKGESRALRISCDLSGEIASRCDGLANLLDRVDRMANKVDL